MTKLTAIQQLAKRDCASFEGKSGCVFGGDCRYFRDSAAHCRYFEEYVLPADQELEAQYWNERGRADRLSATDDTALKACKRCRETVRMRRNAQYCDECREILKRESKREYARKWRRDKNTGA